MYFVTTIDSNHDDTRCVGYFKEFKDAEIRVLENVLDIYETCYDYAVIENVPEGFYQYDFTPKWYKWNVSKEKYEKIKERPEKYKNTIGFAIG